ncbi:hypothetical protein ACLOJK_007504 [Asimina triloba]
MQAEVVSLRVVMREAKATAKWSSEWVRALHAERARMEECLHREENEASWFHEKVVELTAQLRASRDEVAQLHEQVLEGVSDSKGQAARSVSSRDVILVEYVNSATFRHRLEFEHSHYAHDGFTRVLAWVSSVYPG